MFFLEKKAPGRDAPHRRPNWDAPKPPFPIKINPKPSKNQIIGFWRSAAEAAACKPGQRRNGKHKEKTKDEESPQQEFNEERQTAKKTQ